MAPRSARLTSVASLSSMKLLARKEAQIGLRKENETLLDTNIRLRQAERNVLERLNSAKENYDPEKMKALKDFEIFVSDINDKKSKLLEELNAYGKLIEERKEIYYGLIQKQDLLDEKLHQVAEENKKLDLREAFVVDLEKKFREKQI